MRKSLMFFALVSAFLGMPGGAYAFVPLICDLCTIGAVA